MRHSISDFIYLILCTWTSHSFKGLNFSLLEKKEMHLFLVLFILAVNPCICKRKHDTTCDVVPKNIHIEVGSNISIVCLTCGHGEIYWTLNTSKVDKSLSTTINSSHTLLSLWNFTNQRATLQCHSKDTHQVIGGTTIRTYLKPRNISCIWHYSDQETESQPDLFTCKWEHQIDPKLDVNYTVLHSTQGEICNTSETTCTVKDVDSGPNSMIINIFSDSIQITVRAKTAALEVDSYTREFQPRHIWKMIPPHYNVTTFSDHLLVVWKRALFLQKCQCEVKYNEMVLSKALEKQENGNMTIEQVESCSNYTVSVRCALLEAPWSDWSKEKTVLTKLNKNYVKLCLWRKVAEPKKNGVRTIHAMWKIPSTCRDTFTYTITPTPYQEALMGGNYTETLCSDSSCDVEVNQDAHRINLNMFHNVTLLVEDTVHVPAIGESLPRVTNIQASALEGVILLNWKAPVQPVSGYMIDWTHNGNQYYWKKTNYTNATLSGLLDKKPYNVTVTPLFDDKTGHGTQALQICSRVGGPGNVTIDTVPYDKYALVKWEVKSQEECSGDVVRYIVFYSKLDGPQLNVTINGGDQEICLVDLLPDTHYRVYVEATAPTGTTRSNEMLFKTLRFGQFFIPVLGVSGGVVILLVLSLGLGCCVWWRKFKEKLIPNPGCSSLALWPALTQEGTIPVRPFRNPSESVCDRIYTEESQRTSTSPLDSGFNPYPAIQQIEEYIDPDMAPAPEIWPEEWVKPAKTQHPSSPNDSIAPLLPENSPGSPYRSQISGENPGRRPNRLNKNVPVQQSDRKSPVMVYVTLDMFEQNQCS
ncbi:interleukin-31 receptor subunit alpha-like isoform X2 [Eleginops maclovinus]|uniref:interleukin-31 receptor subunit alpha-like isoform X2 n=1 Tax=Eleginops maclovinus TaxID=56733 RepID=UPI0030804030